MRYRTFGISLLMIFLLPSLSAALYDAFGKSTDVTKDWGFSALVEYDGKRILVDTGNNADTFEHNVKAMGVDLQSLDFVVISHRTRTIPAVSTTR